MSYTRLTQILIHGESLGFVSENTLPNDSGNHRSQAILRVILEAQEVATTENQPSKPPKADTPSTKATSTKANQVENGPAASKVAFT